MNQQRDIAIVLHKTQGRKSYLNIMKCILMLHSFLLHILNIIKFHLPLIQRSLKNFKKFFLSIFHSLSCSCSFTYPSNSNHCYYVPLNDCYQKSSSRMLTHTHDKVQLYPRLNPIEYSQFRVQMSTTMLKWKISILRIFHASLSPASNSLLSRATRCNVTWVSNCTVKCG